MRALAFAAVALVACAPDRPERLDKPRAHAGWATARPPATPCIAEPPPYVPPPGPAPACHRASPEVAALVTPGIVADFHAEHDGGHASVAFPCDGLGDSSDIREIVIERGGGHANAVDLYTLVRRVDDTFDVRGVRYRGDSMLAKAAALPYESVAGEVPFGDHDLDLIRAALAAEITEQYPPPPPDSIGGFSFTTSSADFHARIRLVDGAHRVLERTYTGYGGSGGQAKFLGLQAAMAMLSALWAIPGTAPAGGPTADDRAVFAAHWLDAVPHFDDEFFWWVMEAYVDLARHLGGGSAIPGLVGRLTLPPKPDRARIDARAHAVAALATITGWTPPGELDARAAAFVAACR